MSPFHGFSAVRTVRVRLLILLTLALLGWVLFATPRSDSRIDQPWKLSSEATNASEEQRLSRAEQRNFMRNQHKALKLASRGGGDHCIYNVQHLGNALQAYRFDHTTYPSELKELVPEYIEFLPTCAPSGRETYSAGYGVSAYRYRFELHCPKCDPEGKSSYISTKPVADEYVGI